MSNAGKCTSVNKKQTPGRIFHSHCYQMQSFSRQLPPTDNLPHIPTRTRRQETTREKQKQSSYGILCTCGRGGRKRKKKKSRPSGTPRERSVVVLEKVCMQVSLVCVMRCVCVCSAAQAWMAPFFPPHRVKEMNDSLK